MRQYNSAVNADDILGRYHTNKRKFEDDMFTVTNQIVGGALPNLEGTMQSIHQKDYDNRHSVLYYKKEEKTIEEERILTAEEKQLIID